MGRTDFEKGFLVRNQLPVVSQRCISVLFWGMLCVFFGVQGAFAQDARYVFLFIGDGMGIAQRAGAARFSGAELRMDRLPVQGVTTTHAADRFITDSAAAGTALACGRKTKVGMIGMDSEGRRVRSIAETARDKGFKVGIISSVSIDHSTPAAFYAHVGNRKQFYDIEVALAESGFDFFGGGGVVDPENSRGRSISFRGNALELIKKNGYRLITDKKDFLELGPGCGNVYARNARLQAHQALPYAIDSRPEDISLGEFTAKAIELLEGEDGFFLMVEGGKIDWGCHANDAVTTFTETLALDAAIDEAYAFYQHHPSDTLIVVTADHECGGLSLGYAGTRYASNYGILRNQKVSFQKFYDEVVCPLKHGDSGWETVRSSITKDFGLKFSGDSKADPLVVNDHEEKQIKKAFELSRQGKGKKGKKRLNYLRYGGEDPLTVTLTHILNHKAGLAWASYKHTAVPVITSAIGAGSRDFSGYYDNTDIAGKIMEAMGIESSTARSKDSAVQVN